MSNTLIFRQKQTQIDQDSLRAQTLDKTKSLLDTAQLHSTTDYKIAGVEHISPKRLSWSPQTKVTRNERKAEQKHSDQILEERRTRSQRADALGAPDESGSDIAQPTEAELKERLDNFILPSLDTDEDVLNNFETVKKAAQAAELLREESGRAELVKNTFAYMQVRMDLMRNPAYGILLPHELILVKTGKLKTKKTASGNIDVSELAQKLVELDKLAQDYNLVQYREEAVSSLLQRDERLKSVASRDKHDKRDFSAGKLLGDGRAVMSVLSKAEHTGSDDDIRLTEKERLGLAATNDILGGELPEEITQILKVIVEYADIKTTASGVTSAKHQYAYASQEERDALGKSWSRKISKQKKEGIALLHAKEKLQALLRQENMAAHATLLDAYITKLSAITNGTLDVPDNEVQDYTDCKTVETIVDEKTVNATKKYSVKKKAVLKEIDRSKEPLFTHEPCTQDISQGGLGDCYFLASLASVMAKSPDAIKSMMKDNGDSVTVRFYAFENGQTVPKYYKVSKKLYAGGANDTLWVQVMEKAFAIFSQENQQSFNEPNGAITELKKAKKSSKEIDLGYISNGGHMYEAFRAITGKTSDMTRFLYVDQNKSGHGFSDLEKAFDISKRAYKKEAAVQFKEKETRIESLVPEGISLRDMATQSNSFLTMAITYVLKTSISSFEGSYEEKRQQAKALYSDLKNVIRNLTTENYKSELSPDLLRYLESLALQSPQKNTEQFITCVIEYSKLIMDTIVENFDKSFKEHAGESFAGEDTPEEVSIYNQIKDALDKGMIVGASTMDFKSQTRKEGTNEAMQNGIAGTHAYSVIGVEKLKMGEKTIRMVKLRNPWGVYTPDYVKESDGKISMQETRSKTNGVFMLELNDFLKKYEKLHFGTV
ncbi:MAG: hypothetical protein K6E19_05085 [Lachnospiraceae bacterium]|nr:hypothetical protein [Lachnospiraceae bacterium]